MFVRARVVCLGACVCECALVGVCYVPDGEVCRFANGHPVAIRNNPGVPDCQTVPDGEVCFSHDLVVVLVVDIELRTIQEKMYRISLL